MWNRRHIDQLAELSAWTYQGGRASAAEPAAWSALALAASGRLDAALAPANWLASLQQASGAVGVSESQETPRWPTNLATLAWRAVDLLTSTNLYADHIEQATEWILANHGKAGIQKPQIGHDTTLIGWSWAADTHSWLEPTCFAVLALKSVGLRNHPRTCEGVKLIFNRLLPSGAANYGNTVVLGQELLPHPQPTGIVMLALADESHSDPRVDASLNFLKQEIEYPTGLTSLCFAIIGLTAHGRRPENVRGKWQL